MSPFVGVIASSEETIFPAKRSGLTSDAVLAELRDPLVALGYSVETSKRRADKARRPVLFGEQGAERVAYEVDAGDDGSVSSSRSRRVAVR